MNAIERVRDFFFYPVQNGTVIQTPAPKELPQSVVLLCSQADALTAGSALAIGLAKRCRSRSALLTIWRLDTAQGGPRSSFAFRRTKQLASQVEDMGIEATPAGRLLRVLLPPNGAEAEMVHERLASLQLPTVSVLCGPRDMAIDRLINRHDSIYVASDSLASCSTALNERSASSIACLRPPITQWTLEFGLMTKMMARSGLIFSGVSTQRNVQMSAQPSKAGS